MEAMCIVFVFAGLVCLGLLSPLLYAAATVLRWPPACCAVSSD